MVFVFVIYLFWLNPTPYTIRLHDRRWCFLNLQISKNFKTRDLWKSRILIISLFHFSETLGWQTGCSSNLGRVLFQIDWTLKVPNLVDLMSSSNLDEID
jgi:hypothetical protein